MARVLLASGTCTGSLTAAATAGHRAAGLRRAAPGPVADPAAVADGGEGTAAAARTAGITRGHPESE